MVADSLSAGGAGVSMGRNIFASQNPAVFVKALNALIHQGKSLKSVINMLRGELMELWLDLRYSENDDLPEHLARAIDRKFGQGYEYSVSDSIITDIQNNTVGSLVNITDSMGQETAKSLIGSVNWVLAELGEWKMIPLENLVAASNGTPTKIAAVINSAKQVTGAAFALELGVDALLLKADAEIWEVAVIAKAQRIEMNKTVNEQSENLDNDFEIDKLELEEVIIDSVESGEVGDRVCIDFTRMLDDGDGLLVGSSSSSMILVHAETLNTDFVPARPFRVNAGAVHGYTMKADGSTAYLSEVSSGDILLISNCKGKTKKMQVGRVKIERRPMLKVNWTNANANLGNCFLQQAETVRLVDSEGRAIPITSIKIGQRILARRQYGARHIGLKVDTEIEEK